MDLKRIFGVGREEVWRQLCQEIGASFIDGGFWRGDKVVARLKSWTVTLDLYRVSTGHSHVEYTRLRAPFVNRDGFRFRIYRKGLFSGLGKALGMQDIESGHSAAFDDAFILQGNDESKVRRLLANPEIRRLLEEQPRVRFELKDDEGLFGARFPDGVDELQFLALGFIRDVEQLKALFDLFHEVLGELHEMGSAGDGPTGVIL